MIENFASDFFGWILGSKNRKPTLTPSDLDVGDSFYQVRPGNPEWVIDRICVKTSCDIPHVVISRKGNFPDTKVLSAATLLDLNLYRHDRREPDVENETPKKRRKADRKH
jgi:hypothetical protein